MEFGGGAYSTPLFLGFDFVTELLTIEPDPYWRRRLRREHAADDRFRTATPRRWPDLDGFDLILVDDGQTEAQRQQTIDHVLSGGHPLTVIHDAEAYIRQIIGLSPETTVYTHLRPGTAVCW